jgi:Cu(I)/Ag(I) efflux system membrane fusion protein
VLIQAGEGRFEPREVKLGARSDTYVEVIDGVKDGEPVVVAANFLIDAESNLKAAVGGFGHSAHGAAPKAEAKGSAKTPVGTGRGKAGDACRQRFQTRRTARSTPSTPRRGRYPSPTVRWPASSGRP